MALLLLIGSVSLTQKRTLEWIDLPRSIKGWGGLGKSRPYPSVDPETSPSSNDRREAKPTIIVCQIACRVGITFGIM